MKVEVRKVEVRKVEGKRGVSLLLRQDKTGSFVLKYKTHAVYKRREMKNGIKEYDENDEASYIIKTQTKEGYLCFDATRQLFTLGRLVNHSVTPNIKLHKPLFVRGKWRLGNLTPLENDAAFPPLRLGMPMYITDQCTWLEKAHSTSVKFPCIDVLCTFFLFTISFCTCMQLLKTRGGRTRLNFTN